MSEKVNRKKMRKAEEPMQLMHFDVIVVSFDRVEKRNNMQKALFESSGLHLFYFIFIWGSGGAMMLFCAPFF